MTTIDDAKLEQLAAPRPKDLFPILERAESLSPLLVLLTLLPGIIALQFVSVNETDAQWRLKSLDLSTAASLFDAVDPSRSSTQPALAWQPPLGSWIAAMSRHLPGLLGNNGLQLTEYFFAAALVPASYFLIARVLGRRVGFVMAVLVAFHSTFLEQHQHAAPYALAVVAAMGTFWGYLGHIWSSEELVSVDLLVGGISLGLCVLAGGPLAFVVIAVLLLVVVGHSDAAHGVRPHAARPGAPYRARRIWSRWRALRSLGILVATGFAAGGWWELKMLYSHGAAFVTGWLWGVPQEALHAEAGPATVDPEAFAIRALQEFFATSRVLSALTLLGVIVVIRGLFAPADGGPRARYRFVGAWTLCAFAMFAVALQWPAPRSFYVSMWRLWMMLACSACAAAAIDEIARRRISLVLFVSITSAALFAGYVFLHADGPRDIPSLWTLAVGVTLAVVASAVLLRICGPHETRKRLALAGLMIAQIAADASIGIAAVRTSDPDAASLRIFRQSLQERQRRRVRGGTVRAASEVDAKVCILISEREAPYRLQFALRSAWPNAKLCVVRDWDQALRIARGDNQTPQTAVVVDWSQGNSRPANPTGAQWEADPVGSPQFFEQRQLRAYVLVWERTGSMAGDAPEDADSPSGEDGPGS